MRQRNKLIKNILGYGFIGIFFAGILGYLNTNGIWLDSIITTTNTLQDLQIIVILVWVICGIIRGA